MAFGNGVLRFADFGALPKRMLAPIEGYEKIPLITLEEAVKPLVNIVPKVERNVKIVKKKCQESEDGLTTDESAAIMLYTYESMPHEDSLYVKLNESLRSKQQKNLIPWFPYLRLILTALARLPSKCRFVFREVRENLWADYLKSKTSIWWGFSSCTSSVEVLKNEQFFDKTGNGTLYQIECTTAKDIKKYLFIADEAEVLLLIHRKFQVKSCLDSGHGLHIVQLEEPKPQYNLLEPVPLPDPLVKRKNNFQVPSSPTVVSMAVSVKPNAEAMEEHFSTMQLNMNTKSRGQ
ncbi:unnamed protein product [Rotaria sordida]|uniref:NAD(P)(+)--arginine ADP-ribosyltransferase n=1 Tax=Rotaria sordida TaxID=392033 RepID=A0A813UZG2_9BILA|nr:unnamed protein product [Rotaria sordida]